MLSGEAGDAENSESRVLLIGCDRYDDLEQLPSVRQNLLSLSELLEGNALLGRRHCKWILGPNREDFAKAVNAAAKAASDLLLVYYAGHGLCSEGDGTLVLATKGTSQECLWAGLEYEQVRQALRRSRAQRKVVILDCCFSGRAISPDMGTAGAQIADHALIEGTYTLTASAPTRIALAPVGAEHTAFTGEMVAVLREGIPGAGPALECDAIYKEVHRRCRSKSLPEPQQRNTGHGGLISLARNPAYQARFGLRPRPVALEPLEFTMQVDYDPYPATSEFRMVMSVSTRSPGGATPAAPPGRKGLVLLVGCAPSMEEPPAKLAAARAAIASAVAALRDGVRFAIVAGTGEAAMIYPYQRGLAIASQVTRAEAVQAAAGMRTGAGVAFSRWLSTAGELLRDVDLGHAILLTDSCNGESPAELAEVLAAYEGKFSCDCRGVGTNWHASELRRIATTLSGTVDIIPDPRGLADDFASMAASWMGKTVSNPVLRLWTPGGQVRFLKQGAPTIQDLTQSVIASGQDTVECPLGVWGVEARDYHLAVSLPSQRAGIVAVAVQAGILCANPAGDEELAAQTVICARWTDDEALRIPASQRNADDHDSSPQPVCATPFPDTATYLGGSGAAVLHYAGQDELARVIEESLTSRPGS